MKRVTVVVLSSCLLSLNAVADDAQDRAAKSREAVKEFQGTLGNALQTAMKEGDIRGALCTLVTIANGKSGIIYRFAA